MHASPHPRAVATAVVGILTAVTPAQEAAPPTAQLQFARTIALPGVKGRIDHLACSTVDGRLFVAALGNGSVEVVDLQRGARERSLVDLDEPQGIAFVPDPGRVVVACGGDGTLRGWDCASWQPSGKVDVGADADNVRLAADGRTLLVACDGGLARVRTGDAGVAARIAFAGHAEGFQLLDDGRALVNVPGGDGGAAVLSVDLAAGKVLAKWPLADAASNFPLAIDRRRQRALIGCRAPSRVLALDPATGKIEQSLPCGGDVDDLFVDAATDRLFAICGEGTVDVFAADATGAWQRTARVPTRRGARTGLLVPEQRRLFVAAPAHGDDPAEIREFALGP